MSRKLRVGIVGLGRIFDLHARGYQDNPHAEVVALCDAREDLRQRRAVLFPAARLVADLPAMLDQDLDLIEVLTPHPLHAEMAIAALCAGAHVSVQKPMAMTLAEADAMVAAARTANRSLRVFENFVFYPPLVRAKALLDSGAIGRPLHFRMKVVSGDQSLAWPVPAETTRWRQDLARTGRGGPLIFDHGHHMLAVARIETTELPSGRVVDAPASITWRHVAPPVHGMWDVSVAPKMRIRTDYYAAHEQFEIQGESGLLTVHRASDRLLDEPVLTLYADGEVRSFHDLETDWGESFRLASLHFTRFLAGEEPRPVLTGEEGRRVLEFAHVLLRSSVEERPLAPAG